MVQARRFDSMLRQLGLSRPDAAKMLQVSERTLHNWISGQHAVPYAAYKLVRLLRFQEIPFRSWEGWHFSQGMLWSPEGHGFSGKDGSWWGLLVRQARMFTKLYQERQELLQQLEAVKLAQTAQVVGDGLVDLGMDGGLPVTQTRFKEGAPSHRAELATHEGAVLASGFAGEMPVTPHFSTVGGTNASSKPPRLRRVEMPVTPQPSLTGETFDDVDCPASARFVRSRLGRFLPDGGLQ